MAVVLQDDSAAQYVHCTLYSTVSMTTDRINKLIVDLQYLLYMCLFNQFTLNDQCLGRYAHYVEYH